MIFSKEKWNTAEELQRYISVSRSTSFDVFEAPLRNAYELFIRPLLGLDMCVVLDDIYLKTIPSEKDYLKATKEQVSAKLLYLAQRANSILALWYDYHELNTLIDDSGVRRQTGGNSDTPYKYQELAMKNAWKTKGFNALDDLLAHIERYISFFPEYADSGNYTGIVKALVRNAAEVDEYFSIGKSRLVFLRLRPHIKIVEDTIIAPRLGKLYDDLKDHLQKKEVESKYQGLRLKLVPVVVFYALKRMLLQTGDLTDKGLFFQSVSGENSAYERMSPVSDEHLSQHSKQVQDDGDKYWSFVEQYLQDAFEVPISGSAKLPVFDNDNKTIIIL